LIDEASQAFEQEALLPITKGAKRVVMVGDQKQLGPVGGNDVQTYTAIADASIFSTTS